MYFAVDVLDASSSDSGLDAHRTNLDKSKSRASAIFEQDGGDDFLIDCKFLFGLHLKYIPSFMQ